MICGGHGANVIGKFWNWEIGKFGALLAVDISLIRMMFFFTE
jgi:hypothetical protein